MSTSPASINTMVSSNNLCIQPATCGRMTTSRASREDATKLYLLPIKQSFSENMLQVRIHAWLDSSGIQDGPTVPSGSGEQLKDPWRKACAGRMAGTSSDSGISEGGNTRRIRSHSTFTAS